MTITIHHGDSLVVLPTLPPDSVDGCCTDPPYCLDSIRDRFGKEGSKAPVATNSPYSRGARGFMGMQWDDDIAFKPDIWREVYRVLKPGAYLVAFGGTRTHHRLMVAIEDAGFEIRDVLCWLYSTGFPKSHSVSKAIDKAAGREREIVGVSENNRDRARDAISWDQGKPCLITTPASDEARQWNGWGTGLSPGYEPIVACAKPLTISQHFSIVLLELCEIVSLCLCNDLNAQDVAKSFLDIQARLLAEANIVLGGAKIQSLESIGIVPSAALNSTFNGLVSIDHTRTWGSSALSHVRQQSSEVGTLDQTTQHGPAADILTQIMGMSTSVMMGNTSANIVSSWLSISDGLLNESKTFTISTASRLTTALKILSLSMSQPTSGAIGSLSPNYEPIVLARKPLEGTVAQNVLKWGTGAINIEACRVPTEDSLHGGGQTRPNVMTGDNRQGAALGMFQPGKERAPFVQPEGRWPKNVLLENCEEVFSKFPQGRSAGLYPSESWGTGTGVTYGGKKPQGTLYEDTGSAARFFNSFEYSEDEVSRTCYCPKASKAERCGSSHPTVKPIKLLEWLCKLITQPGGTILDPFAGTGSTGLAAVMNKFDTILIEQDATYVEDIKRRLELWF